MTLSEKTVVIPAKAGIHFSTVNGQWIPAFAGMTNVAPCNARCEMKAFTRSTLLK
jgi:hypothetical protein